MFERGIDGRSSARRSVTWDGERKREIERELKRRLRASRRATWLAAGVALAVAGSVAAPPPPEAPRVAAGSSRVTSQRVVSGRLGPLSGRQGRAGLSTFRGGS